MPDYDYKEINKRYRKMLDYEIGQQNDPSHFMFIAKNYGKEYFKDEDLIELRGYYKGLKVAREIMERTIAYWEAENGIEADGDEND